MRALLAAAALSLVGFQCAPAEKQLVYVESPGFCQYAMELEASTSHVTVASGLAVGDCVELAQGVTARLCCPADAMFPRRCGDASKPIATRPCNRVIVP